MERITYNKLICILGFYLHFKLIANICQETDDLGFVQVYKAHLELEVAFFDILSL